MATPSIMDRLNSLLNDPNSAAMLGLAAGMGQASGPHSMTPVSLGQVLASGLQGAQAMRGSSLSNAMQAAMLPFTKLKTAAAVNYLTTPHNAPSPQNPQVVPQPLAGAPVAPMTQPNPPQQQPSTQQPPQAGGLPNFGSMSPGQKIFEGGLLSPELAKYYSTLATTQNPQLQAHVAAAKAQATQTQVPMPADMVAQVFPKGVAPGYVPMINPTTGTITLTGKNPIMMQHTYNSAGFPISKPIDLRTQEQLQAGIPKTSLSNSDGQIANQNKTAQFVASYQMPLPANAMNSPAGQRLMATVQKINPHYSASQFPVAQATLKAFTSGPQAQQVKSFNVAIQHLSVLSALGNALQNNDVRAINATKQEFKKQFGYAGPLNFDAAKQLVADEVNKAVAGVAGGESERNNLMANISASNSPAQLNGVISTFEQLMAGQLNGLKQNYESGTQQQDFNRRFLTPASRAMYKKYEANPQASNLNSQRAILLEQAKAAIAAGAPRAAVLARIEKLGMDPTLLGGG